MPAAAIGGVAGFYAAVALVENYVDGSRIALLGIVLTVLGAAATYSARLSKRLAVDLLGHFVAGVGLPSAIWGVYTQSDWNLYGCAAALGVIIAVSLIDQASRR